MRDNSSRYVIGQSYFEPRAARWRWPINRYIKLDHGDRRFVRYIRIWIYFWTRSGSRSFIRHLSLEASTRESSGKDGTKYELETRLRNNVFIDTPVIYWSINLSIRRLYLSLIINYGYLTIDLTYDVKIFLYDTKILINNNTFNEINRKIFAN